MAAVIRQALLIAAKDTRMFFRDRFAVFFSFLFPLVFVIGFSLALGDVGPDDEELAFFVSTQEDEGISRIVIDEMTALDDPAVEHVRYDEAVRLVESGEIDGFALFPANFTERLLGNPPASIEVVLGDASPSERVAIREFAASIAERIDRFMAVRTVVAETAGPEALARIGPGVAGGGLVKLGAGAGGRRRAGQRDQLHPTGLPDHVHLLRRRPERGGYRQRAPESHARAPHVQWGPAARPSSRASF